MTLAKLFEPYVENSGIGSTLEYTAPYREFLTKFIADHHIKSILDLGCGDLVSMDQVLKYTSVHYVGFDCLTTRVARNRTMYPCLPCYAADIRTLPTTPMADLVICKDVLQHWDTASIINWLGNMPECRYALVTNCARGEQVNWNIAMGEWRPVDLVRHPFSIGKVVFSWDTKDVVQIDGRR